MKKSAGNIFTACLLCLFLCLMLLFPAYVTEGAKNGLLLWYGSVVPALFPFMVLSGLIVAGGGVKVLTAPLFVFLHPILGLSASGCYVLAAGLLCGYPMGAKTCADFIREGRISRSEGQYLMAFCNHPGPMFLLGFAYPLLGDQISLTLFLVALYAPVLLIAGLAKCIYPLSGEERAPADEISFKTGEATLDETILNAVEILCKIGGYLILFSIGIVFLLNSRFLFEPLRLFLIGVMEMTTGIKELTRRLAFPLSGAAACAALSFGGFSGLFQTKAVIGDEKKAGLSIRHYFLWKVFHSACSFFLFLALAKS